ncbi:MAG TPA: SIS domain-containing protein [Chloroflexota bacterium]|nr:SIS domain-containing protein [Chloroflexota bacterium]
MSSAELDTLRQEIGEQPAVVGRLLVDQRSAVDAVARAIRQRQPSAVVFVARGSSDNAAVYGRYLLEVCNRQLTSLAAPSGLTLYGRGPRLAQTVVIGISQSGQGEDVVAYLREARAQGGVTVAIVNDEGSPLALAAEWVLACLAGPEVSVPATKTVTAQMTLLAMLSAALDDPQATGMLLDGLPVALEAALRQGDAARALAGVLAPTTIGSVIGRGFAFPPALEIALKLKETSYTAAEPFSAADFLHGPVALVDADFSALVIDVGGQSSEAAVGIARAVGERGGRAALLQAGQVSGVEATDYPSLTLRAALGEPVAPIAALVLGQLLAVELAVARGLDPARPRGLRKVTSTR